MPDVRTFDPGELADALEADLPAGLRALADALEQKQMQGCYLGSGTHGFGCGNDEVRMDVTVRLRVPLRRVQVSVPELPVGPGCAVKVN